MEGNRIIETPLILSHIRLKPGAVYSGKAAHSDVRHLFSLGFFDDIQVIRRPSPKGLHIVYSLKERAHIGAVTFEGNENISTEDLKELSLLKEHSFLNFALLKETSEAFKKAYREKGFYLVKISHRTEKIPGPRAGLRLILQIEEGKKLLIKRINFIGNIKISSQELKAFMLTKERDLFSFLGSSGIYRKELIERDRQALEYYYRDQGYLNVRVDPPEITVTPDKRFLYINFPIVEGPRFKMGRTAFEGDGDVPEKTVTKRLKLKG